MHREADSFQMQPGALNTCEAARYIGVGKSDLDNARSQGSLSGITPPPFVRIGTRVRYRVSDLDNWLRSLSTHTTLASETASRVCGFRRENRV